MPIASQRGRGDERAALLPPELLALFNDGFIRSCDRIEEYVGRLAVVAARALGLDAGCARGATVDEAIAAAGLAPTPARVPVAWLFETLARRGLAEREAGTGAGAAPRYRIVSPLPALDPEALAADQAVHDPSGLPSFRIAALAAERYPAVLRGEVKGEDALFGPDTFGAWSDYFSNSNPLYAISNQIGALAVEQALAAHGGAVLEIGGGLGSGAEAVLARVAGAPYRFTEISALFLRRAKRALTARFPGRPIEFAQLDIDAPFGVGGAAPGAYAIVYGVNVLHVARDLAATLAEIRTVLEPGGALVISECVRPFPGQPVHVEFVFNLLATFRAPLLDPRWRPNGGFLTPEQWTGALAAGGFDRVHVYPDIAAIRDAYPSFVAAAIVARRA